MADIYIEYLPITGNADFDLKAQQLVDLLRTYISEHDTSLNELELGITLNETIIEIGDWNMDSTGTLNVAHGLTYTKIRGVHGVIKDDAGTNYYPLTTGYDIASSMDASIYAFDTTNVKLTRKASGFFDSVNFDSTSYNRGWITIKYTD